MIKNKIIGIDLGTTNCCISVIENQQPRILANSEGKNITPSVVAFVAEKDVKSGESSYTTIHGGAAQRQAYTNDWSTIYAFKRLIGRQFEQVKHLQAHLSYKITSASNGEVVVKVGQKVYTTVYISSILLRKLVEDASSALGETIKDVVITVPAHFDDAQRQATKSAGIVAGLNVMRIISEPTAAALAYGLNDRTVGGNILVYDLGGGTFDVSILKINDGFFDVIRTGGNTELGGEDFDNLIYKWIMSEFKKAEGIELTESVIKYRVKEAAKQAKEQLSNATSTKINVPYVAAGPKHIDLTITRAIFEVQINNLVDETVKLTKSVIKESGLEESEFDRILLVGGSSRVPLVHKKLSAAFKIKIYSDVNPDEAIAVGAAYQGSILSGETTDIVLSDIAPLNIGIETLGGIMTSIIDSSSKIPCDQTKQFTTAKDNQTEVEIKIYQGNRPLVADNRALDTISISGIKPNQRGIPQIDVNLALDVNGILTVSVSEKSSNISKKLAIEMKNAISKDEIKKMQEEAEAQKEADTKKLKQAEETIEVESLVYKITQDIDSIKNKESKESLSNELSWAKSTSGADFEQFKKQLGEIEVKVKAALDAEAEDKAKENPKEESKEDSEKTSNESSEDNPEDKVK